MISYQLMGAVVLISTWLLHRRQKWNEAGLLFTVQLETWSLMDTDDIEDTVFRAILSMSRFKGQGKAI